MNTLKPNHLLQPGCIFLSRAPLVIQTVLGDCVSVCLWDKLHAVGSMNHFLYPCVRDKNRATPQYGNVATLTLIRMMEEAGCERENLVAHILGGACPPEADGCCTNGKDNAEMAKKVLEGKSIQIISEDTGGTIGRKVVFDVATGHVAVLKVHNLRKSDWVMNQEQQV